MISFSNYNPATKTDNTLIDPCLTFASDVYCCQKCSSTNLAVTWK